MTASSGLEVESTLRLGVLSIPTTAPLMGPAEDTEPSVDHGQGVEAPTAPDPIVGAGGPPSPVAAAATQAGAFATSVAGPAGSEDPVGADVDAADASGGAATGAVATATATGMAAAAMGRAAAAGPENALAAAVARPANQIIGLVRGPAAATEAATCAMGLDATCPAATVRLGGDGVTPPRKGSPPGAGAEAWARPPLP